MADDYTRITRPHADTPHTIDHPTQAQPWGTNNFEVGNENQRTGRTSPDLGDLQRRYDFGNTYTKLSFQRDPFQHLLIAAGQKKFVSDSKFEYAIKRSTNVFKRYGYVLGVKDADAAGIDDTDFVNSQAAWDNTALRYLLNDDNSQTGCQDTAIPAAGSDVQLLVAGDYKTHGNLVNKIDAHGTASKDYACGAPLTRPNWFLKDMVIRIPTRETLGSGSVNGYALVKLTKAPATVNVHAVGTTTVIATMVSLYGTVIKCDSGSTYPTTLAGVHGSAEIPDVAHGVGANSIAEKLEPLRTYIAGSAYHELSGYGDTTKAQPFTTDYGYTQIFKKTAMMSGRAMATALKFGENPWKNEWADKMTEMTWEIGQAGYFGEQYVDGDGVTYTEGLVNFILNNGNTFSLDTTTKTLDDFLDDMSAFFDPRFSVAQSVAPVYYCSTAVWNWLAKMGGFAKNNLETSPNYSMQFSGQGKMGGVSYRQFDVDGSSIRCVRDIHLDGTNVKMIGANMKACKTVALKGNGINRDMAVYPGVKTIKNSGEDYRVDLIQADVGFEFSAPETHAVWL
tara:strand:+ start:6197 stop:7885 length:1689 start_codon:yes stop_codon:yes gene_type:complete